MSLPPSAADESSPLEVEVASAASESTNTNELEPGKRRNQWPDYATFQSPQSPPNSNSSVLLSKQPPPSSHSHPLRSLLARFVFQWKSSSASSSCHHLAIDDNQHVTTNAWKLIVFTSIAIALLACLRGNANSYRYDYMAPEWHWDHNVYIPRSDDGDDGHNQQQLTTTTRKKNRISLLAQVVPSRSLQRLTEIASRPNRAYARQWGIDYTRFNSGRMPYSPKSCFDKVFVLNTLLEQQHNREAAANENNEPPPLLWPHTPPRVRYDSIILLPPDSIVTDLDKDLLDILLPDTKLVAIAGWDDVGKKLTTSNSNSDVILFNLQHRHADAVAKLWWEMALPVEITCGANNDLGLLITAIASVMDPTEDLDDLIEPLKENRDGFVGDHLIKCIPPSVPGSRATLLTQNLQQSQAMLQETADAVCYRFYPKCEVL
jgi:hypothetical protein